MAAATLDDGPANALEAAQPVITVEEASKFEGIVKSLTNKAASLGATIAGLGSGPETSTAAAAPTDEDKYYWEAGVERPPLPKLIGHNLHWIAWKTWGTMEYVGEFFSEFLGLYNSRYEWAVELERRETEAAEESEANEERKRRWAEIQRLTKKEQASQQASGAAAPVAPGAAEEAAAQADTSSSTAAVTDGVAAEESAAVV